MKLRDTILLMVASFAFAAAAFAGSPNGVMDTHEATAVTLVGAEVTLEAPASGVYDAEAMVCIEAAPEVDNMQQEVRCWKCSGSSTGSCSGGDKHCYGERSDCTKKGCKITGSTSKCSGSKKTC